MQLTPLRIYKYRSGTSQDLESLRRSYVWAASLATLNDPFESAVTVGRDAALEWIFDLQLQMLRMSGICSFSQTPLDARAWAYYANGCEGYCVEYDAERLLQSIGGRSMLLQMQYSDAPPTVDLFESLRLILANEQDRERAYAQVILGTKERGWSHEQEWRLITSLPGAQLHDPAAVTGVYIGYRRAPKARKELLRSLGKRSVAMAEVRPSACGYEFQAVSLS